MLGLKSFKVVSAGLAHFDFIFSRGNSPFSTSPHTASVPIRSATL
jgi:hypothetical protein